MGDARPCGGGIIKTEACGYFEIFIPIRYLEECRLKAS
jgi:hypothetical protein